MPPEILRWLSIVCGFLYLVTQPWQPYTGSVVVKGLSVGPLALLAFFAGSPMLGAALALSTLGDVLLDLDPAGLFVFGLGSFLVAHLVYISVFIRDRRRMVPLGGPRVLLAILVLLCSAAVSGWLLPSLGDLIVPVAIYMCAITAMVIAAILGRFENPWVAVGAILFLISDSLLAINKFKTPVPYRDFLVWSTYYTGQYGIAIGFLNALSPRPERGD
ncbi:MAG: lysoplasmalogenase [Bryobacteraceae bacterium]|jgi:uncharacterized membrane protein YhhN